MIGDLKGGSIRVASVDGLSIEVKKRECHSWLYILTVRVLEWGRCGNKCGLELCKIEDKNVHPEAKWYLIVLVTDTGEQKH